MIVYINNKLETGEFKLTKTELGEKPSSHSCHTVASLTRPYPIAKVCKTIDSIDLIQSTATEELSVLGLDNRKSIFVSLLPYSSRNANEDAASSQE